MIKKARLLIFVFFQSILKEIRKGHMSNKRFIGRYVDVEIERRNWAKKTNVIIIGEKNIGTGIRKVREQIIFYVPDTMFASWLGFKKNRVHYELAGWFQKGPAPVRIGGITLEGNRVR